MRLCRALAVLMVAGSGGAGAIGCASSGAKPAAAAVAPLPPPPSLDTRLGWILRLEQQRTLRDADVMTAPGAIGPVPSAPQTLKPALNADLAELVRDVEPRVRNRAALAIGRVKDAAGVPLLTSAIGDSSPEVRASAAFALGLIGDREAVPAVRAALTDASVLVRGRSVEALGLIGDATVAPAIVQAAAGCPAALAPVEPDADLPSDAGELTFCRLAVFALVRLRHYDGLAQLLLDSQGQPVSRWWPVAYAFQRIGDPRAAGSLRALASGPGAVTVGFALRGLTALKDPSGLPIARAIVGQREADVKLRVAAVRFLAVAGSDVDVQSLIALLAQLPTSSPLALEVVAALGTLGRPAAFDVLVDALVDPSSSMRAAALSAAAKVNPEGFLLVLSGLGRDRDWTVRAALASVLASFPSDRVSAALVDLATDEEPRVHGAALEALAKVKSPELPARLSAALVAPDFVARATAARLIGETKPAGGVELLIAAYARAAGDTAYAARAAALEALASYGGDDAVRTIEQGLNDREWPVRTRAAELLVRLGRAARHPVRPAPVRQPAGYFESAEILHPRFSPHALIETRHGTIEIELDVVEAPVTSATFVELARSGFFNGIRVHRLVPAFVIQAGDPRGDGEGGPGFTQRDELNTTPYLRGTVGMALDWAETGGSQWFITLSPQPHLDARYTAFGRVVNGWVLLDQVSSWDAIERVRIWDGVELR